MPARSRPLALATAALVLLVATLLAESAWVRRAKSITFDETFYLSCALQSVRDGRLDPRIAGEGVAPLPLLLSYFPPLAVRGDGEDRPDPWKGEAEDPRRIAVPRLMNSLLCGVPLVVAVFVWLYRRRGPAAALFGAALVALSPTTIAHASLATTDVCFALVATLALAALVWYLRAPSRKRLVVLAIFVAAAMSAKYSGVFLLPVVAFAFLFLRPKTEGQPAPPRATTLKDATRTLALFACLFAPLWWGFHLFSFTGPLKTYPLEDTPDDSPWVKMLGRGPTATRVMDLAHRKLKRPAPVAGLLFQHLHNQAGHHAFLMGERSDTGWWYYYPCAFAFKSTPADLAVTSGLILLLAASLRRPRAALRDSDATTKILLLSIAVFTALVLTSRIAIGHRYLIVLYPLLAILAADRLFTRLSRRPKLAITIATLLAAGQAASNAAVAPNWLAYFNAPSGGPSNGWKLLVDSSLDWGQDLPALADELAKRPGERTALSYFGTALPSAYGVAADPIADLPRDPADYNLLAVSATHLQGVYVLGDDPVRFFRTVPPTARAADSIFLFALDTPEKRAAFRTAAAQIKAATEAKRAEDARRRRAPRQVDAAPARRSEN